MGMIILAHQFINIWSDLREEFKDSKNKSQWLRVSRAACISVFYTRIFFHFCILNSPNVNSLFYSFAGSPSVGIWGETLKAFVFSLNNSEDLPPFKCFTKNKYRTVYKSSSYGPRFGKLEIAYRYSNKRVEARAFLYKPYSGPAEVKNNYNVLVGTAKPFSPDNYEVFFLTWKSSLEKNKQTIN